MWVATYLFLPLHPFVEPYSAVWHSMSGSPVSPVIGYTGIVLHSIILTAILIPLSDRFDILPGGFSYILGLYTALMTWVSGIYIFLPVGLATGFAADILYQRLKPWEKNPKNLLLFSFAIPVILGTLYFGSIKLAGDIVWSIHTWGGSIATSGLAGIAVWALYSCGR
jgi:hypothetical protein